MPIPKFYMVLTFANGAYDPYTRSFESYDEAVSFCSKQVQRSVVSSCVIMESIKEVSRADNPINIEDIN